MVAIPSYGDPTIQAMLQIVANRPRDSRDYLGASSIGDPCARKLWYKFNKYPESKSDYADIGNCAADSGHYAEEATAKRLKAIPGLELLTHKDDGSQFGFSTFDGKFKGHVDGLILKGLLQAPKAQHVWEHKDKDHKKFADFQNVKMKFGEKNALKNWDETYYAQAQTNMHFFKMDRHYLTVSYAGARRYDSCRTEYNPVDAEMLVDKAYKIISATQEPQRVSENADFFLCKFCPFKDICHGGK